MCYGCESAFCTKHFIEHRQELSQQMDDVGQVHDVLRKDLTNELGSHPALAQINQWEQESIIKIQTAAQSARVDLQKLLHQVQTNLKESVSKMTTELQSHRESDDYTEIDIKRWIDQLQAFRSALDAPININIEHETDPKARIYLIKVNKQQSFDLSPDQISPIYEKYDGERFIETFGKIKLSKDGLLAWCLGDKLKLTGASGMGRYSSGIHIIRIRIERINAQYPFLGIVSSSETIRENIFQSISCNGWRDFNYNITNGQINRNRLKDTIEEGDEVTLILDCDNRDIQLQHPRTQTMERISINLRSCSFPWKFIVLLCGKDDSVRILR